MSLSRLSVLNNPAATTVVLAAANRMTQKPMIPMKSDDHHHDDHHMSLPNQTKASTSQSLGRLLLSGNLTVSNSFTSWFILMDFFFPFRKLFCLFVHENEIKDHCRLDWRTPILKCLISMTTVTAIQKTHPSLAKLTLMTNKLSLIFLLLVWFIFF